jgi:hypothetical protein
MPTLNRLLQLSLAGLLLAACSSSADLATIGEFPSEDTGTGGGNGSGGGRDETGDPTVLVLSQPAVTRDFVVVANRDQGALTKIQSSGSLSKVTSVEIGGRPTEVFAVGDTNRIVAFGRGEGSFAVVDLGVAGEADRVRRLPVLDNCNQITVSPDGLRAVLWYDNAAARAGEAMGPLSEVALLDLSADGAAPVTIGVGVNVRQVSFAADGSRAVVVSDDGASVLDIADITSNRSIPPIPLSDDGVAGQLGADRDVFVTEAADFAVVRRAGIDGLGIVNLETGAVRTVATGELLTDIELLGPSRELALLSPSRGAVGFVGLEAAGLGSGSGEGSGDGVDWVALPVGTAGFLVPSADGARVFATGGDVGDNLLASISVDTHAVASFNLRKNTRSILNSSNGRYLLVVHGHAAGRPVAGEPEEELVAKSSAVSVVDLEQGTAKLVLLPADPGAVALNRDESQVLFVVSDEPAGVRSARWIAFDSFAVQSVDFTRQPTDLGALPGSDWMFVTQSHPQGRISFLNLSTGAMREVTGFSLNAFIE